MHNLEIRKKIKLNRLYHYEVAREIGVSEATLCIWLRDELSEERKNLVLSAVEKISRRANNG